MNSIKLRDLRRALIPAIFIAAACGISTVAYSQTGDSVQHIGNRGVIDWTAGELKANGIGAIPRDVGNDAVAYLKARDYASLDAMRNLLMVIKGVHIDATTTGANYMATSSVIRAHVQGLLRGARIISTRTIHIGRDAAVEVTVTVPMYGSNSVASAILPARPGFGPSVSQSAVPAIPAPPLPAVQNQNTPVVSNNISSDNPDQTPYTSVIIDARGTGAERSMCPKIVREDGSEVWGTVNVAPRYVIDHGIAIYANSIAAARRLARAGTRPLILRARDGGRTASQSDVVLSYGDANRLLLLNNRYGFLNNFHVIIVLNPGE